MKTEDLFESLDDLRPRLVELRGRLEKAFSPETALRNSGGIGIAAGQCAATAAIVFDQLGGRLVSTKVQGESHWFNRIAVGSALCDVDITGDQFGRPVIQISEAGTLYESTREREPRELNEETIRRATKLAQIANIRLQSLGLLSQTSQLALGSKT